MHRRICLPLLFLLTSCLSSLATSPEKASVGRAKFELYGMLNEYMARFCDGHTVERFYPHETAVAAHFEEVLRQFCAEEHITPKYEKRIETEGHISFSSAAIAAAVDKYYPSGVLEESVFADASQADLLRYVAGAYQREGDEKKRAVLFMANAPRKMRTVGMVLARLGCTHVRMYSSRMTMVPTSFVLLFSPSTEVKSKLGIQAEVSLAELPDGLGRFLTLEEEIQANQALVPTTIAVTPPARQAPRRP